MFSQKVSKIGKYSDIGKNSKYGTEYTKPTLSAQKHSFELEESIITKAFKGTRDRRMQWSNCGDSDDQSDEFKVLSLQIPTNESLTIYIKFYPAIPVDDKLAIDYEVKLSRYQGWSIEL